MKRNLDSLRGSLRSFLDTDLQELRDRLNQNFFGDLAKSLQILEKHAETDKFLLSAGTSAELFQLVDLIQPQVDNELRRRLIAANN